MPAPEAAYDPSVEPTGAKSAARLVRTMQVALLPFHGLMIAAADDDARGAAITALTGNLDTARAWGAPLQAWPGYAR